MKNKDVQLADLIDKEPCGCCVALTTIALLTVIFLGMWGISSCIDNAKRIKVGEIVRIDSPWGLISNLNHCLAIVNHIDKDKDNLTYLSVELIGTGCATRNGGHSKAFVSGTDVTRLSDEN